MVELGAQKGTVARRVSVRFDEAGSLSLILLQGWAEDIPEDVIGARVGHFGDVLIEKLAQGCSSVWTWRELERKTSKSF